MKTRKNRTPARRNLEKLNRAIGGGPAGLERLEDRTLLTGTPIHVTNTDDAGEGSLRWAIDQANENPDCNVIDFDLSGSSTLTIQLQDALTITGPVVLKAPLKDDSNEPLVWLNGLQDATGVNIDYALSLEGAAGGSTIQGLGFINFDEAAVHVLNGFNTIGGMDAGQRNFFLGVQEGVLIEAGGSHTSVIGNVMAVIQDSGVHVNGLSVDAENAGTRNVLTCVLIAGNTFGLNGTGENIVGTQGHAVMVENTAAGSSVRIRDNTSAGSNADGLRIQNASGVVITGNRIGTDLSGGQIGDAANTGNGIAVFGSTDVRIGGTAEGQGNLIAGNWGDGIWIENSSGNTIAGNTITANENSGIGIVRGSANAIAENKIYDNGGLGIDLMTVSGLGSPIYGPTTGATAEYGYLDFPTLTTATDRTSGAVIRGTFGGAVKGHTYTVRVYANSTVDEFGDNWDGVQFGEGEQFLGTITVVADADGTVSFRKFFAGATTARWYTATVSDAQGNTSEFSAALKATPGADPVITTALTSTLNPSTLGQAVTLTAHVLFNGAGATEGVVRFMKGTSVLFEAPVDAAGNAEWTTSSLAVGSHDVTAVYVEMEGTSGVSSNTLTQVVNKAASTTTVNIPGTPVVGHAVEVKATVASGAADYPAGGTVVFYEGGIEIGHGTLAADGTVTISHTFLTAGSHTVTATYEGDADHDGSTKDLSRQVQKAGTTTTVSSSGAATIGESVTLTATVSTGALGVTVGGAVTFREGNDVLGSGTLNPDGTVTISYVFKAAGPHLVTATYSGDENFNGSTRSLTQQENKAGTTTKVISPGPVTTGGAVTLTATVTDGVDGVAPGGVVKFFDDGVEIGSATLGADGTVTFTHTFRGPGSHAVTAAYQGDDNFNPNSGSTYQQVDKAATSTSLATPGTVTVGNPVTLTASVNAPTGLAVTGFVKFYEGANLLGTIPVVGGQATLTLAFSSATGHDITAVYSGDANLNGSNASVTQQVDKADSATTVTPVDAVAGTPTTLAAHVTGEYGSVAGGLVYFFDGSTKIGERTLDTNGNVFLPWTFSTAGAHSITATYLGNANLNGSTNTISQQVSKADSTTVVTLPGTVTVGTQVTITATVSDLVGIDVDGTVTFFDGHIPIRTVTLTNGVATLTYTFTTSGPHDVTATYGGNTNLEGSTDSLAKSVNVADTTTTLTSSANPSTVGNNVTLTAHVTGGYGGLTGGTVIFMEGGVELDRATVDADGNATVTYGFDTVGGHQVTAIFVAFGESAASASSPLNQVVNAASTTTTLTGPVTSTAGQSVTFTATIGVLGSTLTPAGVVKFYDGSTLLGTVPLAGNAASLTLSNLAGGSHTITAVFISSAASHTGSASDPLAHSVVAVSSDVPFKASGRTLRDTTGNGLSSDDTALANVRVNIFKDSNNNGVLDASDALFTFVTTNSSGLFTLDITPAGLYFAQEVTPSGYLQTGPVSGYYKFTASVNNSTTSLDFSNWKQCDCCDDVVNITYIVNGTTRVNDLRGNTNPGDVVQAVFTVPAGHTPITVSLVTYTAPSGVWDATVASQQKIWEQQTGTFGPGTYTLTVNLPETFYQVDFVCGPVIDQLGPVGSNIFYSAQNRLFSADNDGALAYVEGTSSISGYVYNDLDNDGVRDATEPGIAGVKVLLSGNNGTSVWATTDARGRYAFANVQPGDYTITETQPAGYLNGKETPSNVFSSVKITTARGSRTGYNFGELAAAKLSGFVYVDKNNDGVKQSTEKGLAGVTMRLLSGTTVVATTTTDSTGAYSFSNVAAGAYTIVESQPANYVDGIETAGTLGGYDQGDNNTISSINVASGAVGTNYNFGELPESFVTTGETATIGFWQNKNGQNLIKSFNGSATCKTLAKWLAQTFPNLYGGSSPNSLVGKNNNDVAALFIKLFNVSGQKLDAQVLGVALAVYSTTNSLGGTAAAKYGFTVDAIGTGNRLYNIGGNGAAFGVANNTNMAVIDILDAANDRAVNGVLYNGNTTLRNMANVVFTGINEQGDI